MELSLKLALWIHLLALSLGGVASFGIPALVALMSRAEGSQKPVFGQAIARLASLGRMALVILVLSGGYIVWGKYPSFAAVGFWFDLKMVLVVALIGLSIFNIFNARRVRAGDAAAIARLPLMGRIGMGLLAGIVLLAVIAFG